jgi:hypothetical protein
MKAKMLDKAHSQRLRNWMDICVFTFVAIFLFYMSAVYVRAVNSPSPFPQTFIIWFQMFMLWAIFVVACRIKDEIIKTNRRGVKT